MDGGYCAGAANVFKYAITSSRSSSLGDLNTILLVPVARSGLPFVGQELL
jgi:hypothetical protein